MNKVVELNEETFLNLFKRQFITLALLGECESGKTTFLFYILNSLKGVYDNIFVLCGTTKSAEQYLKITYSNHIFVTSNSASIDDRINTLNRWVGIDDQPKFKTLLIFDDLGSDMKTNTITNHFNAARHALIDNIILMHDWKDLIPKTRKSLKYIILCPPIGEAKFILEEVYGLKNENNNVLVEAIHTISNKAERAKMPPFSYKLILKRNSSDIYYINSGNLEKHIDNDFLFLTKSSSLIKFFEYLKENKIIITKNVVENYLNINKQLING